MLYSVCCCLFYGGECSILLRFCQQLFYTIVIYRVFIVSIGPKEHSIDSVVLADLHRLYRAPLDLKCAVSDTAFITLLLYYFIVLLFN
jgi:hypothetical protein